MHANAAMSHGEDGEIATRWLHTAQIIIAFSCLSSDKLTFAFTPNNQTLQLCAYSRERFSLVYLITCEQIS